MLISHGRGEYRESSPSGHDNPSRPANLLVATGAGMAKPNVTKMQEVLIDTVRTVVAEGSRIGDVVDAEVQSVTTFDLKTGKSEVIRRDQFTRNVPRSFTTDLTPIEKGRR